MEIETDVETEVDEKEMVGKRRWNEYLSGYFKKRYHSEPAFKQKMVEASMKSRAKKPEHYRQKQKEWREKNKDKMRDYMRSYRDKKKGDALTEEQ